MKTRFGLALLALIVAGAGLFPSDASGIPVFARKYGVNCTMCHSNIPRLNDFGQRYRSNGYRMPGLEGTERTVLESPAPVAFRTSAGYNGTWFDGEQDGEELRAFQMNGLDVLSAGMLGQHLGYFMVYVPQISESRGVAGQAGSLEMASVVLSDLGCNWLNLRVGRFEPAYVPFSVKRQLTISAYEVYDAAFPGGPAFSETQSGLEASGWGSAPVRYAAGVVTGSETNEAEDTPIDFYGRASFLIGAGEGQTAGQRLGVVGYLGSARPESGLGDRESFYRLGADASLNVAHFNLALQYLHASDKKALWHNAGSEDNVTWSGGFAELSYLPLVKLVGFARYDFLDAPDVQDNDVTRITLGGRYYLEDNVAIHTEFSRRSVQMISTGGSEDDDAVESFITARLDVAF